MKKFSVAEIQAEQTLAIRQQVLWPSKALSELKVAGDDTAWHLGGFSDGQLSCVASFYFSDHEVRLRKFATLDAFRGQGLGSVVLEHSLAQFKQRGVALFWCDARESAIGFYQRFGLTVEGERFYKGEIPYFKMILKL
ncbi:GNAT family N-acetyltransferase [Vibrio sp. NTOU-M3]|uniref:GNAT family N-acetyltransferase n=1 Tax=Vibrio sp. NTOU-M3 TaxID=3234954 RepID=UPI00349FA877